jgi:hypothetical protein
VRVIAVFFGPGAPDVLTSHVSVSSHDYKRFDQFTKLATSTDDHHILGAELIEQPVEVRAVPAPAGGLLSEQPFDPRRA